MSDFWNPPKRTEEEWDKLPPLVAKGEVRATKLAEIVEKWCTPSPAGQHATPGQHIEAQGFEIEGRDLVDANTEPPTPIDLGKLFRDVEATLRASGEQEEFRSRIDLHIIVRNCRVRKCLASGVKIRPRLSMMGSSFEFLTKFESAVFCDHVSFRNAEFGTGTSFKGATFGDRTTFDQATFGVTTKSSPSILSPTTTFTDAKFGVYARFDSTRFVDTTRFDHAAFGRGVSFEFASFEASALFAAATFGDRAMFAHASFRGNANFANATFGTHAAFDSASFEYSTEFFNARFGSHGGIGKITVASVHRHTPANTNKVFALLERLRRTLAVGVTWNLVRGLGEFAILNRASMLSLILVPLVAGAWPAVHSLMLGYAFGVKGGVAMYDAARTSLLLEASRIPGAERVPDIVGKLDAQVSAIADQLQHAATQEIPLPVGWGLLFFGALAVVLGKSIYGLGAPEGVRQRSRTEAVEADSAEFREKADQKRDLLLRAITRLQTAAKEFPEVRHPTFVKRHAGAVWVPKSMEEFDEYRTIYENDLQTTKDARLHFPSEAEFAKSWKPERPPLAETPDALAIILIEEGAKAQYDLDARENAFRMNLTTFLYATGLYCIAWLLAHQATAILKQSGALEWSGPDWWAEGLLVFIIGWWAASFVVALPWLIRRVLVALEKLAAWANRSRR